MKVFLDTNVLVSAFTTRGLAADVLRTVILHHELVVGEIVLRELRRVLQKKMGVPLAIVRDIEVSLREGTVVPCKNSPASISVRDPDDVLVLASAERSGADVLVTGDNDLLVLAGQSKVKILNPRGFWELTRRKAED